MAPRNIYQNRIRKRSILTHLNKPLADKDHSLVTKSFFVRLISSEINIISHIIQKQKRFLYLLFLISVSTQVKYNFGFSKSLARSVKEEGVFDDSRMLVENPKCKLKSSCVDTVICNSA